MNKIVIGLGFGDEGKGIVTDYLCSRNPNVECVVRFNGGHQAGHTVVTDETRHVFSNFGSGTLREVPTYWGRKCTVEPFGLLKELDLLRKKGFDPKIYIDGRCAITTPFELYHNRITERNNKHGTCGVGFGATIEREENFYSLTFLDLFYPKIFEAKLNNIRKYYDVNLGLEEFYECCKRITKTSNIVLATEKTNELLFGRFNDIVFEGAQGLLLDQHFGFFPNVTRSNTGCKNAIDINNEEIDIMSPYEVYLVTRAYQTRHGNGFMTNEDIPHDIQMNPDETNTTHEYQGNFRRSILDLDLIKYGIEKDIFINHARNVNLVITCLDHLEDYKYTINGEVITSYSEEVFVSLISQYLEIDMKNIYLSHSDNSKDIKKAVEYEKIS